MTLRTNVQAASSKASSVEPTRAKPKATKKREAVDLDLSDEEEKKSSPPAKKKKAPAKKAPAKVRRVPRLRSTWY